MGRDDGFAIADVSTKHLDDDKVRKLWRILAPDVGAMCEAITVHLAVVLASWGSGRRMTVDEAAPLWLSIREETVPALVRVGLLDARGRVPARSWSTYFGPAAARKKARQEAGRLGGQAKAQRRSSNATAELYPSGRQAGPSSPSVPDRPPREPRSPRGRAPRGDPPVSLGELMKGAGGFAASLVDDKKGGNR